MTLIEVLRAESTLSATRCRIMCHVAADVLEQLQNALEECSMHAGAPENIDWDIVRTALGEVERDPPSFGAFRAEKGQEREDK